MNWRLLLGFALAPGLFVLAGCGGDESETASAGDPTFVEALMVPGPLEEIWLGSEDAPVTVIEYASMTCSHCRTFHVTVFDAFLEEFVDTGTVRFLLREFPLDVRAEAAFMLARCATGENAYYGLIEQFFETQDQWAFVAPELFTQTLLGQATQAGFTADGFEACLTNQQLLDDLASVHDRGVELGVTSTPTFFINGTQYPGALGLEQLRSAIAAAQ